MCSRHALGTDWGAGLAQLPIVAQNDNPFPSARSLSPTTAAVGGAEITLTVSGVDFVESSVVYWNGSVRPTIVVDSTTLRANIRAADLATPGVNLVTVFTPAPGGGVSTPLAFSVASEHPDFDAPEFQRHERWSIRSEWISSPPLLTTSGPLLDGRGGRPRHRRTSPEREACQIRATRSPNLH